MTAAGPGLLSFGDVWRAVRRRQSLPRAWMERRLEEVRPEGLLLDVGGGGAVYARILASRPGTRLLTTDVRLDARPSFVSDAESGLPLRDGVADGVFLLNVLEHVYDPRPVLTDIGRVLRPGGRLVLFVPGLYPRHTARYPSFFVDDHHRFGPETLRRLIAESGRFRGTIRVEACGRGPFSAAASLAEAGLPFRWTRAACLLGGWALDAARESLRRSDPVDGPRFEWPLGYWAEAVK